MIRSSDACFCMSAQPINFPKKENCAMWPSPEALGDTMYDERLRPRLCWPLGQSMKRVDACDERAGGMLRPHSTACSDRTAQYAVTAQHSMLRPHSTAPLMPSPNPLPRSTTHGMLPPPRAAHCPARASYLLHKCMRRRRLRLQLGADVTACNGM